jgi:hypothetical protein
VTERAMIGGGGAAAPPPKYATASFFPSLLFPSSLPFPFLCITLIPSGGITPEKIFKLQMLVDEF